MFLVLSKVQLCVKAGPTNIRKQLTGLAAVVQEEMELEPFQKTLFIFCNHKCTLMEANYWERNGFLRHMLSEFISAETEDDWRKLLTPTFSNYYFSLCL